MSFEIEDWSKAPALAKLKEIYFDDYFAVATSLGSIIIRDNANELSLLISKYFANGDAKELLNTQIAIAYPEGKEFTLITPLILAVESASRNTLSLLLNVVKTPNLRTRNNSDGATLLMIAAAHGDIETIRILVNAGADVNLKTINDNGENSTALTIAMTYNFEKTANFLLDQGVTPTFFDAILAIENKMLELLKQFVQSNSELIQEHGMKNNLTLLHHAAGQGNRAAVEYLVSQGADINARNEDNVTPLDFAIFTKNDAIAKYLQSIGGVTRSSTSEAAPEAAPADQQEMKQEITGIVERLELMEEKFGISIEGLYATCEKQTWRVIHNYEIKLNFDVAGTGADLQHSFFIRANAYNAQGQLLGTQTAFIHKEKFMGFESETIQFEIDQPPTKLRLFPSDPI